MRSLDKMLLRDLSHMRGQALTIAFVVACGVAALIAALSTFESLRMSRDVYYAQARFADVFASLKRAPVSLTSVIRNIPGVGEVEARVVGDVSLDMTDMAWPAVGHFISLPSNGPPQLDMLYLRRGRMIDPAAFDEIVINEGFATAHGLVPGDSLRAILNGKYEMFRIVGIVLSPEYIYALRSGDPLPDDRQFGVVWANYETLAAAFDMKSAFNDLTLSVTSGASIPTVLDGLDNILAPYGGHGAYDRRDQQSNRFIADEIAQQGMMAATIPPIFLGVAAFLLNLVLSRLIGTQREQIAALKAIGYDNRSLAVHYLKMVSLITFAGIVLGLISGAWLGHMMTLNYLRFFRFPILTYHIAPWHVALGAGINLAVAVSAALSAVAQVVRLSPAEAMRPMAPRIYRRPLIEGIAPARILSIRKMMVLRSLTGRPVRTLLTILGLALALPITITGLFWRDAIDYMIAVEFSTANRGNATVTFTDPVTVRGLREIEQLPGVEGAEGVRFVAVRLRAGHRSYRTVILGLPAEAQLRRVLNAQRRPIELPPEGLLLSDRLAERLHVDRGDRIEVEVLEGARPQQEIAVVGLTKDLVGLSAYMSIAALNRLMRESDLISEAVLSVDKMRAPDVYAALKLLPKVATVGMKAASLKSFLDTTASFVLVFTGILTGFAVIIAVGVVYNSARIALSERARDLASLRVLGFTRAEVSRILFGELGVQVAIAIPIGLWLGHVCVWALAQVHVTEQFEIPPIIEPRTYALAALIVAGAATLSALIVHFRISRLDLVGVLKSRE